MVTYPINLKSNTPTFTSINLGNETLGNYDEGTWTPGVLIGSTDVLTSSSGRYTRIGDVVYIHGTATFNRLTNTGSIKVTGLPLTSASNNLTVLSFLGTSGIDQAPPIIPQIGNSTTEITLKSTPPATGGSLVDFSDTHVAASTAVTMDISGFYFV